MHLSRRPVEAEDQEFLRAFLIAAIAEEFGAGAWPEPMRSNVLDLQYRARIQGIRTNYPQASQDFALVDGTPAGWLVVARASRALLIVDLLIASEHRRKGIGGWLLRQVIEEANAANAEIHLMVNVMNHQAIRLYEKFGFVRTGGNELQHAMTYRFGSLRVP